MTTTDRTPALIHETVLLHETVAGVLGVSDLLGVSPQTGVYVDATFGRGGHSRLLLDYLTADSTLIVFDKDPQAIVVADELAKTDSRVVVVHDSFASLNESLAKLGMIKWTASWRIWVCLVHSLMTVLGDLAL